MLPEGIEYFAGDLTEEEKQVVCATANPPAATLFRREGSQGGLEGQAELVHRGAERPKRPTPTLREPPPSV